MNGFLQRTGYAEDQILISFANLLGNAFFAERKDILVNDESLEYRAPLIAALVETYLRDTPSPAAGQEPANLPARALILTAHREVANVVKRLLAEENIDCAVFESATDNEGFQAVAQGAPVVLMPADAFLDLAADERCRSREFTCLVIEGADTLSEQPTEVQRKIWSYLLPPWERRTILFAAHVGIRTKNLAIDFANNLATVVLKKAQAALNAISTSMYRVSSDRKFRLLLWLIRERARQGQPAVAVFCNLRQTSREVEARLRLNGISAEHISSAAPKQKNSEIFAQFAAIQDQAAEGTAVSAEHANGSSFALCISNDNLEALPNDLALLGIHFDIPLDADVYLERVRVMRSKAATMIGIACERYEVGLSAITSRFGTKFEILEPSAEMLSYPDASDGVRLELELPRREDSRGPREPRTGAFSDLKRPRQDAGMRSQNQRSAHSRERHGGPKHSEHQNSRERIDQSLYSMSTEERLAFFRNKYRGILKSPVADQTEKHKERKKRKDSEQPAPSEMPSRPVAEKPRSAQPVSSASASAHAPAPQQAPTPPPTQMPAQVSAPPLASASTPVPASTPASAQHSESTKDGEAMENGGKVKRFIDKLFSGDKESGADS